MEVKIGNIYRHNATENFYIITDLPYDDDGDALVVMKNTRCTSRGFTEGACGPGWVKTISHFMGVDPKRNCEPRFTEMKI